MTKKDNQTQSPARQQEKEKSAKEEKKNVTRQSAPEIDPKIAQGFAEALQVLNSSGRPYLVGAAFARNEYTGIWRETKDLDVFVKAEDLKAVMEDPRQQAPRVDENGGRL